MHLVRRLLPLTSMSKFVPLVVAAWSSTIRLHAAAAGNLPWEKPMTAIATSLTGPVAYAIGLIGIAIAGGAMLWGGELTEFGRRACMIGLVGNRSECRFLDRCHCRSAAHRKVRSPHAPSLHAPHTLQAVLSGKEHLEITH
jgi:type IV secretory pathway VirB2 component (pilin)